MATQVYPVNQNQTLRLVVNGDLFLSGSNQSQVKLSVDELRDLVVRLEGELVDVLCRDDVIVTIPDTMPVVSSAPSPGIVTCGTSNLPSRSDRWRFDGAKVSGILLKPWAVIAKSAR